MQLVVLQGAGFHIACFLRYGPYEDHYTYQYKQTWGSVVVRVAVGRGSVIIFGVMLIEGFPNYFFVWLLL